MVNHLEPDILECELKWALGSITTDKVSGGNGIQAELFQILKGDSVKVLHNMQAISRVTILVILLVILVILLSQVWTRPLFHILF